MSCARTLDDGCLKFRSYRSIRRDGGVRLSMTSKPRRSARAGLTAVGTWLSLVEHSLGVRGVGSSNLPVPTNWLVERNFPSETTVAADREQPEFHCGREATTPEKACRGVSCIAWSLDPVTDTLDVHGPKGIHEIVKAATMKYLLVVLALFSGVIFAQTADIHNDG